jgi:cobalamin biosynthesis protein CobT
MCFFTFKRPGITDGNAAAYLSDGDDESDDDESDGSDDGSDDGIDDGSAEDEEESEVGSERDDVRGEAPAAKKARTRGVEKVVGPNSYDSRGG